MCYTCNNCISTLKGRTKIKIYFLCKFMYRSCRRATCRHSGLQLLHSSSLRAPVSVSGKSIAPHFLSPKSGIAINSSIIFSFILVSSNVRIKYELIANGSSYEIKCIKLVSTGKTFKFDPFNHCLLDGYPSGLREPQPGRVGRPGHARRRRNHQLHRLCCRG